MYPGLATPKLDDISKFDEFTLFPKVSIEVRIMIWNEAMPSPRNVLAVLESKHCLSEQTGESRKKAFVTSPLAPPITLSVCQESRKEALKIYKPVLAGSEKDTSLAIFYVNPLSDTLVLGMERANYSYHNYMSFDIFHEEILNGLEHLAAPF